jgi:hypothetical protein
VNVNVLSLYTIMMVVAVMMVMVMMSEDLLSHTIGGTVYTMSEGVVTTCSDI